MSELNSYYYYEDRVITPATHQYRVYHADEVDKVIAGKDKEITYLRKLVNKLLKTDLKQIEEEVLQKSLIYGEGLVGIEYLIRLVAELRQQKYKRCKALARYCHSVWCSILFIHEGSGAELYMKWERRWLALAKHFKEAK